MIALMNANDESSKGSIFRTMVVLYILKIISGRSLFRKFLQATKFTQSAHYRILISLSHAAYVA